MIPIKKGPEPLFLAARRQEAMKKGYDANKAYGKLKSKHKKKIRECLVSEQGNLCAYCMCEIPRGDVDESITPITIEHYVARSLDTGVCNKGLDYQNMLAVCHGNKGPTGTRNPEDWTCDVHRGNMEFKKVNPLDASTLESIFYTQKGEIDATDPDVRYDLNTVLNLNSPTAPLISERKSTLDGMQLEIENDLAELSEDSYKSYYENLLYKLENEKGKKTPYVGILIWYLRDLLHK